MEVTGTRRDSSVDTGSLEYMETDTRRDSSGETGSFEYLFMLLSRGETFISVEDFQARLCTDGNMSAEDATTIVTLYDPDQSGMITCDQFVKESQSLPMGAQQLFVEALSSGGVHDDPPDEAMPIDDSPSKRSVSSAPWDDAEGPSVLVLTPDMDKKPKHSRHSLSFMLRDQRSAIKRQRSSFRQQQEQSQADLQAATERVHRLEVRNLELQRQVRSCSARADKHERGMQDMMHSSDELRREIVALKQQLRASQAAPQSPPRNAAADLETEILELRAQCAKSNAELVSLRRQLAHKDAQQAQLQASLEDARQRLQSRQQLDTTSVARMTVSELVQQLHTRGLDASTNDKSTLQQRLCAALGIVAPSSTERSQLEGGDDIVFNDESFVANNESFSPNDASFLSDHHWSLRSELDVQTELAEGDKGAQYGSVQPRGKRRSWNQLDDETETPATDVETKSSSCCNCCILM